MTSPITAVTLTLDDFDSLGFTPSCMVHPSTYLNKVLFGSEEGTLQLWNIHTVYVEQATCKPILMWHRKLIHTFKGFGGSITCLVQAPAIDIVAVGTENGDICVHNLKFDKTLFRFKQDGPVTALSFRTGNTSIFHLWLTVSNR